MSDTTTWVGLGLGAIAMTGIAGYLYTDAKSAREEAERKQAQLEQERKEAEAQRRLEEQQRQYQESLARLEAQAQQRQYEEALARLEAEASRPPTPITAPPLPAQVPMYQAPQQGGGWVQDVTSIGQTVGGILGAIGKFF